MRGLWFLAMAMFSTATVPAQIRILTAGAGVAAVARAEVDALARAGLVRLAPLFPGVPKREIRFVLHPDATSIPGPLRAALHPGVPGFARLQLDEIHLVLGDIKVDPPNDLKTTVEHELVHILLDQYVGSGGFNVPRWFHEGLAQDLAGDGYLSVKEEDLIYRVQGRTYIPFTELESGFPVGSPDRLALAYGQSYSFVAFLHREVGLPTLLAAAAGCGPEVSFAVAFARLTREGLSAHYEDRWRDYLMHESGAGYRVLLTNCFMLVLLVVVGPLLAFAVARRRNREETLKEALGVADRREDSEREELSADQGIPGVEGEDSWWEPEWDEDSWPIEDPGEDEDVGWDDWDVGPEDPDFQGDRHKRSG